MTIQVGRQEYPHHTAEQVAGYITDALGIVAEFELDDKLETALVLKAVDLLASKQIVMEQAAGVLGRNIPGIH